MFVFSFCVLWTHRCKTHVSLLGLPMLYEKYLQIYVSCAWPKPVEEVEDSMGISDNTPLDLRRLAELKVGDVNRR